MFFLSSNLMKFFSFNGFGSTFPPPALPPARALPPFSARFLLWGSVFAFAPGPYPRLSSRPPRAVVQEAAFPLSAARSSSQYQLA